MPEEVVEEDVVKESFAEGGQGESGGSTREEMKEEAAAWVAKER